MIRKLISGGLRQRLLIPTIAVLVVCMLLLSSVLILLQQRQLNKLSDTIVAAVNKANASAQKSFSALSGEVDTHLSGLSATIATTLDDQTQSTLEWQKTALERSYENTLKNSADAMATLLAQVASSALLANNFIELINYAKAANRNPDVVYTLFLKPDGKPLTRYIDRRDADIQRFLKTGKGSKKIDKILDASLQDPTVLVVEKGIQIEGKDLGKVVICVSKTLAKLRINDMSSRFESMAEANIGSIIAMIQDETKAMTEEMRPRFDHVAGQNKEAVQAISNTIKDFGRDISSQTKLMTTGLGGVTVLIIAAVLFLIISKMSKTLQQMTGKLDSGAKSVAAATVQISSASQTLASGATEQAASIEETSASLEEMAAMTNQNAQNAGQADRLMQSAKAIVEKSNDSMRALTDAMAEISRSSDETQKIVKTIDEISFQTNLLALNAAVEAARAGEAGAGFAVVADEVRNLALRAADAARDTAALIEGTAGRIAEGSSLVGETNQAFTEIASATTKVTDLLSEIASASTEQAQGVEQINKAVTEMDKVVQTNAANAEESSSASEEMRAQAEQMQDLVRDLVAMVEGQGEALKEPALPEESGSMASATSSRHATTRSDFSPEQVIPLDGDGAPQG
jgi:methyl-accepting chemotaxis protein